MEKTKTDNRKNVKQTSKKTSTTVKEDQETYDLETIENMVSNSKHEKEQNPINLEKAKVELTKLKRRWNLMNKGGFAILTPRFQYETTKEWQELLREDAENEYNTMKEQLKADIARRKKHQKVLDDQYETWSRKLRKFKKQNKVKPNYVG